MSTHNFNRRLSLSVAFLSTLATWRETTPRFSAISLRRDPDRLGAQVECDPCLAVRLRKNILQYLKYRENRHNKALNPDCLLPVSRLSCAQKKKKKHVQNSRSPDARLLFFNLPINRAISFQLFASRAPGPRFNAAAFAFAGDGHHHQRRVLRAADHLQLPHVQVAQHSR